MLAAFGSLALAPVGPSRSWSPEMITTALLESGKVRCWGIGEALGHGNSITIGDDEPPAAGGDVDLGGKVGELSSGPGAFFTCAILEGGFVRCWGNAYSGQLGYGNLEAIGNDEPVVSAGFVDLGEPARHISITGPHACALLESGAVRCWGSNNAGQLGYGHLDDIGDDETPASSDPVQMF